MAREAEVRNWQVIWRSILYSPVADEPFAGSGSMLASEIVSVPRGAVSSRYTGAGGSP